MTLVFARGGAKAAEEAEAALRKVKENAEAQLKAAVRVAQSNTATVAICTAIFCPCMDPPYKPEWVR
jgi:hypothetical protein